MFPIIVTSFVISVAITWISIVFSRKLGMMEQPDGYRKTHPDPVARFGGPPIFIAFFLPLIILVCWQDIGNVASDLWMRRNEAKGLFVGASLALLLGIFDDRIEIRARWKVMGQIFIGIVACSFGLVINEISNPFGGAFSLGIFAWPATVLWFVLCMNAVNLADGMDGLAAGICLFVTMTLFFLCLEEANMLGLLVMASLAGSILGFLLFNFPPAKIFLGNSGSMLLGFLMASLSFISLRKAETAVALFVPIVALGLPFLDTSLAVVRRWYQRKPIATPDQEHIHHVLLSFGYSRKSAVLILYGVCLILSVTAFFLTFARSELTIIILLLLGLMTYVCFRIFSGITLRDLFVKFFEDNIQNERFTEARAAVNRSCFLMSASTSVDEMWELCIESFNLMELTHAKLELFNISKECSWSRAPGPDKTGAPGERWSCAFDLVADDHCVGRLSAENTADLHLQATQTFGLLNQLQQRIAQHVIRLQSSKGYSDNA